MTYLRSWGLSDCEDNEGDQYCLLVVECVRKNKVVVDR